MVILIWQFKRSLDDARDQILDGYDRLVAHDGDRQASEARRLSGLFRMTWIPTINSAIWCAEKFPVRARLFGLGTAAALTVERNRWLHAAQSMDEIANQAEGGL